MHGLIGQIYHNTFEICFKGVDSGGYEVLKKRTILVCIKLPFRRGASSVRVHSFAIHILGFNAVFTHVDKMKEARKSQNMYIYTKR